LLLFRLVPAIHYTPRPNKKIGAAGCRSYPG